MDIFVPIVICFVLFALFSLCGLCCKRRRDQGQIIATPVVITSTEHHVGPYPVTQVPAHSITAAPPVMAQHHMAGTEVYPMPQPMPGYQQMPGGNYPPSAYHATGQQQHMPMPMPMPMPGVGQQPVVAQAAMNPPSYDQVVSEGYARQAPYNPHFTGQ